MFFKRLYYFNLTGNQTGSARPMLMILCHRMAFVDVKEQYQGIDTIVHEGRSVLLRSNILCEKKIREAKAYITGLGFYEFYVNGQRMGESVLTPAKTNYLKEVLYDTYDVTSSLREGENGLGIHLGNGWYNPYKKWWKEYRMQWFGSKRARMQLHVLFEDGTKEIYSTNAQWKASPGPALYNCVYDGEIFDARKKMAGWSNSDFNSDAWQNVRIMSDPGGKMTSQVMPPIKVLEYKVPVNKWTTQNGGVIFDMGQNFTGWVKLIATGSKGTKIRLRFAEDIHADGSLDPSSNEHARAEAVYIMNGKGKEIYEPHFTYYGFQYVELTAEPLIPEIESITGCVVHSSNPHTGQFTSANELVNKIHRATVWSQKSNMIGYPMDCPQRDERLGWLGDVQVSAEQAIYNFDMRHFFKNWLKGIRLNQDPVTGDLPIISPRPYLADEGVEWSSTFITLTWDYYVHYGDVEVLKDNYEAMKRYMDFLKDISDDYIVPSGWIGDWGSLVKGWQEGQPESVPTAYYYLNATILEKIATLLNKGEDKSYFNKLSTEIKKAFNSEFYQPDTKNYHNGSQMANAFPLYLGLVNEAERAAVLDHLSENIIVDNDTHLTTGVLGTKYMPEALAKGGRHEIVWALINQDTYPSWHEMMKRYNTVCEFWSLKQSKNHVMMGSIDAWFFKYIAGIRPDETKPGYKHFYIQPYLPVNLNEATAQIETCRGNVVSGWERSGNQLLFNYSIPFNTEVTILLPLAKDITITENGKQVDELKGIKKVGYSDGHHVIIAGAGNYRFKAEI